MSTATSHAEEIDGLPLTAEDQERRELSFTTDEATWLSVDVAPDGGTLVIGVLGDLYTLPIEGGVARPLERSMAFDNQPAFSPDGKWIAFLSDRDGANNLWVRPVSDDGGDDDDDADDAEPRKLSSDTEAEFASPSWTPDSQYVVVSRAGKFGTFELWMYHVRGGKGVQITEAKPTPDTPRNRRVSALGPEPSPDGRFFYYARGFGGFEYNTVFPRWQIVRRDRTTGDEDTLTAAPGSAMRPRLSPDGGTMVYATRFHNGTALKVRDLESGEERWLAYPVQRDEQESRATRDLYPGYDFTPDGGSIVVTWDGKLHRVELTSGASEEIPFSVPVELELGPRLDFPRRVERGPVRARLTQESVQSPDGTRVAFSALTRLYTAELADSGTNGPPTALTSAGVRAFQPTWSPDGSSIAYVTWSHDGGHVWRAPAGGGQPTRLTEIAAYYSQPSWSPDGSRIVALRGSRQARIEMESEFGGSPLALDLIEIDPAGGGTRLIAPSRGLGRPHFGPEPDRVYVNSSEGLVSMRFDGTDKRTHLVLTGPGLYASEEPVPASDIQVSPRGDWVLARISNRFYLAALPRVGGKAPTFDLGAPGVPIRKLTLLGADSFAWADGGDTITWTLGSTFFRVPLAEVPLEDPEPEEDEASADTEDAPNAAEDEAAEDTPPAPALPDPERFDLTVEVPRSIPRGRVALRGARLIALAAADGDRVIERGDIVVSDDRIEAIGASGEVEIPPDATVIDVTGKTIVPGFVDTHAHWTEIRRGVLDTEGWPFLANLAYGVTTGLDVQTSTNDAFAYQDLIDAGEMIGPRAFSTGPGIFSNNDLQSLEDARAILQRYRDHYRTPNLKAYIAGNRKQRQWIVQAAAELEMMPTTEGALDFELDMTHAIDGFTGNEHSLPITPLFHDVVELYARSGIGYTPTLLVAYGGPWAENRFFTEETVHDNEKLARFTPHATLDRLTRRRSWFRPDEDVYPLLAREAAKIVRAGGRVGVGAHGQLQGLGYHWELWALQSGGLTEIETLRCATLHGAEIIGLAQDLGSLEPGKLADLVVLDRNPLEDIRNTESVHLVMKNGELFEGDTLDRVWPSARPLEPLWWWEAGPETTTSAP